MARRSHRSARKFAEPGNWLTGSERVASAAQVRSARDCELCARSAKALSPFSETGSHDTNPSVAGDPLNPQMIDVLHRLTTDAARLTESYVHEQQTEGGFDDGVYVELLSIVVSLVAIDSFHRALGLPLEPLPEPQAGAPSRYRPTAARTTAAWVPTVPLESVAEQDADMYADLVRAANVLTAMSLVPGWVLGRPFMRGSFSGTSTGMGVSDQVIRFSLPSLPSSMCSKTKPPARSRAACARGTGFRFRCAPLSQWTASSAGLLRPSAAAARCTPS